MHCTLRLLVAAGIALVTVGLTDGRAGAELRIGTFTNSRGGDFAFGESARTTALRTSIQAAFPSAIFVTSNTLTASFLSSVDVVLLASPTADTASTSLNSTEQANLLAFVDAGKGAVLLTDNDSFSGTSAPIANQSFLNPFGLHTTGTLNGLQSATIADPTASPVTNGPFGTVTTYTTNYPGWFDNLGSNSQGLGKLSTNGQTTLATIARNQIAPGSGAIVFFSDASLALDDLRGPSATSLIENALAFAAPVPEPSLMLLFTGMGGLSLLALRRVHRAQ